MILDAVIKLTIITEKVPFEMLGIWDLSPNKHYSGVRGIAEPSQPLKTSTTDRKSTRLNSSHSH